MALPSTGSISAAQIAAELGIAAGSQFSLGDSAVRNLAGVASGQISFDNLHGKSKVQAVYTGQLTVGNIGSFYGLVGSSAGALTPISTAAGFTFVSVYIDSSNNNKCTIIGHGASEPWNTQGAILTIKDRSTSFPPVTTPVKPDRSCSWTDTNFAALVKALVGQTVPMTISL